MLLCHSRCGAAFEATDACDWTALTWLMQVKRLWMTRDGLQPCLRTTRDEFQRSEVPRPDSNLLLRKLYRYCFLGRLRLVAFELTRIAAAATNQTLRTDLSSTDSSEPEPHQPYDPITLKPHRPYKPSIRNS